ncbi:MAG: hypothetical protein ACFB5Z_04745, partial [Elainellaceae cyanobacterium]
MSSQSKALRIEAETMETTGAYGIESVGAASGGKVISLIGGPSTETGSAQVTFSGGDGMYDVKLGYFDENDGVGSLEVKQGDRTLADITLDEERGSRFADEKTLTSRVVEGVNIKAGDVFTINGVEDGMPSTAEHARIDYLEFIPKSMSAPSPAPDSGEGVTLAIGTDSASGKIAGTGGDDVISIRTVEGSSTATTAGGGEDNVILYGA